MIVSIGIQSSIRRRFSTSQSKLIQALRTAGVLGSAVIECGGGCNGAAVFLSFRLA
jgi:hypothetical protein